MVTDTTQDRSFDDALDALADRQRRVLLLGLLEHNPQVVDSVASKTDGGTDEVGDVDLLVRMRHLHLPKLEDYGFVEWDDEAGEVVRGPRFAEIEPLLELLDDHREELPSGWL
jgi:hypothetical protein